MLQQNKWLKESLAQIQQNRQLVIFLGRAFLLFIGWVLIYSTDNHIPPIINKFLTVQIAKLSVIVLHFFNEGYGLGPYILNAPSDEDGWVSGHIILYLNGQRSVFIADVCNGLELYVLYIGYIIAFRQRLSIKLMFIAIGIPFLIIVNIFRVAALALLFDNMPQIFQFAHHYLFTATMYISIFLIWYWYSNFSYE